MGIFWSFISAFLWSTTFVGARYLLAGGYVDPVSLSLIRFSLGGMLLVAYGLLRHRPAMLRLRPADIPRLLWTAFFGIVGMSILLFFGQTRTTAINSSLIMQLNPVIIIFLGVFIGERLALADIIGTLVSLTGTLMVMGILSSHGLSFSAGQMGGDLLVLGAALAWSIYTLISKDLVHKFGGYAATAWVMLAGALELLLLFFILPVRHIWPMEMSSWLYIIYIAVFPTAVAFFAWYEALRLIRLPLLNVMQYLTPFFTIILAALLLGEVLTLEMWIGAIVIMIGIIIISALPSRRAAEGIPGAGKE